VLIGGCTIASAALAPVLMPLILSGLGFGAGGVVSGSVAASIHAAIGNVAAGSLFAMCQAVGAGAALPLVGWLASAGLGLVAGIIIDKLGRASKRLFEKFGIRSYLEQMAGTVRLLTRNKGLFGGMKLALSRVFWASKKGLKMD
jgi:galactitol-specific phosphotransferase system IIC component